MDDNPPPAVTTEETEAETPAPAATQELEEADLEQVSGGYVAF